MKEAKITIKKAKIEKTPDGIKVVRVTLQKGDAEYERGVRYVDMKDPTKKRSVFRTWKKDIDKIEKEKAIKEEDVERDIAALIGEEILDE
jgi:hypothetical protein